MNSPIQHALKNSQPISMVTVAIDVIWLIQACLIAVFFHKLTSDQLMMKQAIFIAIGFIALGFMRAAVSYMTAMRLDQIADKLIADLREQIITKQDRISPYARDAESSASITALLIDKLEMLRPYILRYQSTYFRTGIIPIMIIIITAYISWAATLIFIIAGPIIPIFMALIGIATKSASEKQLAEVSNMNTLLLERLQALSDIRVLNAREAMMTQFEMAADKLRKDTMSVLKIAFLSSTALELFAALGVAMMAVYVGFSLLGQIGFGAYRSGISVGEGVFLLLLAPSFFQPLRDFAAAWHDKASANAVIDEVERALGNDQLLVTNGTEHTPISSWGLSTSALEYNHNISYPDFELKVGERLAILGPSGSGKSTLVGLVGGLIPPSNGHIKIGDTPLEDTNVASWRSGISWIPQRPHFFQKTLRENLIDGLENITDDTLQKALHSAGASEIIAQLPEGLETIIGENGGGISGGEARRLMIARAILEARPLLLADEPTSDLDDKAAQKVVDALIAMNERGTSIIVATHDPRLYLHFPNQINLEVS